MVDPVQAVPSHYLYSVAGVLFKALLGLAGFVRRASIAVKNEWQGAVTKLDPIQGNHLSHMETSLGSTRPTRYESKYSKMARYF